MYIFEVLYNFINLTIKVVLKFFLEANGFNQNIQVNTHGPDLVSG